MRMKKRWLRVGMAMAMALACCVPSAATAETEDTVAPGRQLARQAVREDARQLWITADHSRFPLLKEEFGTAPEVTKACLSCHNEAALQFHKTIHWTWIDPNDETGKTGKGGLTVNNFCINILSNEPRCTSCHAGYGWRDKDFDFSSQQNVDCLVCHEQTGTYKKFPTMAGFPVSEPTPFDGKTFEPPNYNAIAQSVSRPTRNNCGTCHFYGGGGDAVKHGDLDSSMFNPSKNLDVHMGIDGQNFDCVRCHTTRLHQIAGRIYSTPAVEERKSLLEDDLTPKIMCESCHGAHPHKANFKANDHTDKVACQACHIPTFARVIPTKMWWDWSLAGDTSRPVTKDEFGMTSYDPKKGEFLWAKDVIPVYHWFNGAIDTLTADRTIDPSREVKVSWPMGDMNDHKSRIMPFKVHRGKTPYDKVRNNMVIPKLFGPKGSGAYWAEYDWTVAVEKGMAYAGLPFSGEVGFVETSYVYPTTHMVAPKEQTLACKACHSRNGRLNNLGGFYMPGRDTVRVLDVGGWSIVVASLVGVALHALGRVFSGRSKRKEN
ncbi:MAG: tetrathionate reductase family octaheme c-type cytochrome [Deltaproteobacteria bacterium]|nr:tetrathionate reductase family octaheme c-type cytochrome [Deltaproteobacteria bacterium]